MIKQGPQHTKAEQRKLKQQSSRIIKELPARNPTQPTQRLSPKQLVNTLRNPLSPSKILLVSCDQTRHRATLKAAICFYPSTLIPLVLTKNRITNKIIKITTIMGGGCCYHV